MEKLWTPWRMGYVGGPKAEGCIFCDKPSADDDRANLILYRGVHAFAIMNLFPYNTGHVMVVPYQHTATLLTLPPETLAEMANLLRWMTGMLGRVLRPDGFNAGLNIGAVAGAGVAEHLHLHVVPRWTGDANFMPLLANTMVLPELIPVTRAKILAEIARTPFPALDDEPGVAEEAGGIAVDAEGRAAIRRSPRTGDWVLPKGHIEAGESAHVAAVREVAEETGLATRVIDWLGESRFSATEHCHVGYFLLRVERRLPEFAEHEGHDTFLLPLAELASRLTFAADRALARLAAERYAAIVAAEACDA